MPEAKPTPRRAKVILFQVADLLNCRPLALELAGQGHTLALWLQAPASVEPPDAQFLLDLQLAIERAGGISLTGPRQDKDDSPSLAWALEAFGRIDAAVVWGRQETALLGRAVAGLGRRARIRQAVVLLPEEPSRGLEPPRTDDLAGLAESFGSSGIRFHGLRENARRKPSWAEIADALDKD
jgi:hypothetical protein